MTESTNLNEAVPQKADFASRPSKIPDHDEVARMRRHNNSGAALSRSSMRTTKSSDGGTVAAQLPSWLPWVNRLVMVLQRWGLQTGTIHILSLPGRISGRMRATPVSLLSVDGQRYVVAGLDDADWVRNARAAGWGLLRYGRSEERVALSELPVDERAPILRQFPRLVPHGVPYFQRVYGVTADPDAFARLADHCPVFQIGSS